MTETTEFHHSASKKKPQLPESWLAQIGEEFDKPYMQQLREFLREEYADGQVIYPAKKNYFAAFNHTPFEKVRVVILGQDPYHGPGQAHGLCFSVQPGVQIPPSLQNIFKEIRSDLKIPIQGDHGCLLPWADQGVFLLNSVLTVEQSKPGSHQKKGWEKFTDRAIEALNSSSQPIVFMLWGAYAQKKAALVNRKKHLVLESVHPSPLSAHRGFLGCKHFSQCNEWLTQQNQAPIDWSLPSLEQMKSMYAE